MPRPLLTLVSYSAWLFAFAIPGFLVMNWAEPAQAVEPTPTVTVTTTATATIFTGQATVTAPSTDLSGVVSIEQGQYTSILAGLAAVVLCVTAIVVISMRRGGRH